MKKITNESLGALHTHTHTGSLKENKKKNIKGITLVALVVTIVILLIISGISIIQLTGNGLFERAKSAKQNTLEAQEKENATLNDYEDKINEIVGDRDSITVNKEEYEQLKNAVDDIQKKIESMESLSGGNNIVQTGIVEQQTMAANSGKAITVNLPTKMKDTKYSISIERYSGGSGWANIETLITGITETSFSFYVWNNSGGTSYSGFRWSIVGEKSN